MKAVFTVSLLLAAFAVVVSVVPPSNRAEFDLRAAGNLPTLVNGRVKPLDTVARSTLLMLQGRQRVVTSTGQPLTPTEWLLDVMYRPEQAAHYPIFEIVHPEVLALFNLNPDDGVGNKRFSLAQLSRGLRDLDQQAKLADSVDNSARSSFQRAALQLRENIILFQRIQISMTPPEDPAYLDKLTKMASELEHGTAVDAAALAELKTESSSMDTLGYLLPIPPDVNAQDLTQWKSAGGSALDGLAAGTFNRTLVAYARLGSAWRDQQPQEFNAAVHQYRLQLDQSVPAWTRKCRIESLFNSAQPFSTSMTLFVAAFLLSAFSWMKWPAALRQSAFAVLLVAFFLTTTGIGTRMWLEGRPPVTNLYSSALFVGWGAVALCVALEYFYRNAIGSAAAGVIGFCTLLIAHHLALGGDTLEMMRAVLDSNFWLATHVVTIAVGYSATFLAGFLGLIYVFRGVFTRSLDRATGQALARMIYGVICFATLFSFLGTVLGGIWADQSWGRFWGWDPKENGALIIVMWNSVILHARWGGLIKTRGLIAAVIFGNVVTSWSWFGVNMLGVGLHSYGFMESAFWWLLAFVISQLAAIAISALPAEKWRSAVALGTTRGVS